MDDIQAQLDALREQLRNLESVRRLFGDELTDQKKAELQNRIQTLINQGNLVLGDQRIEGDWVGQDKVAGDKWQIILGDYYGCAPDQVPPEVLLRAYYRALAGDCRRLPLGVVRSEFVRQASERPVGLDAVYVDLDVVSPPRAEEENERAWGLRLSRGEGGERTPLLDALSRPEGARAVLLGDAGSGKTTFVNYVTYLLADAAAAGQDANAVPLPETLRGLLPVRLVLRAASACLPADAQTGTAAMIWNVLRADLVEQLGEAAAGVLLPHLQSRLLRHGGFFLLDGLDEVPEAGRRRGCLLEAVRALLGSLPPSARVLLTARPYAYADPAWRLPGLPVLALAPFNEAQVDRFVQRWHQAVRPAMGWDAATADYRAAQLGDALRERPYLADLASRPLLLTLTAALHSSGGQLPEGRADLYEESVKLLLSSWQRGREIKGPDGRPTPDPGIERTLGLGDPVIRAALEQLALQAHERQRCLDEPPEAAADIPLGEVLAAFAPRLPADYNPAVLLNYLETRAGLLGGRREGVYAFPHRSFQEYLAACALANGMDFAHELRRRVWADPTWWREVFLLGVGKAKQGGLGNAVHVINVLAPEGPGEVIEKQDIHWQAAILAAEALLDLRFPDAARGQADFEAVLKRARRWLTALLDTPGALAPRPRAEAGDLLARLGDLRPGIGLITPSPAGRAGIGSLPPHAGEGTGMGAIPDLIWCEVPAGPFLMGSPDDEKDAYPDEKPQHLVSLPTFYIARCPTTNAQYRPFVEAGGYDNPDYWTPAGWAWRNGAEADLSAIDDADLRKSYAEWLAQRPQEKRHQPFWWEHKQWGLPNRPVVGVTWHEAMAYCRWLTERLRVESFEFKVWRAGQLETRNLPLVTVVLPSEAEWEKAASWDVGADPGGRSRKRRWPWGDECASWHSRNR